MAPVPYRDTEGGVQAVTMAGCQDTLMCRVRIGEQPRVRGSPEYG